MNEPLEESSDRPGGVNSGPAEFEALSTVVRVLQDLRPEARERVLSSAATFLGISSLPHGPVISTSPVRPGAPAERESSLPRFSDNRTPSAKDFLFEKRPHTDVDRVVCLAYYLAHYRQTPHFKTLDLSKLNTEAAQLKFSNAAYAVENATKAGFLVPASKGAKQLSALGELYVQALPDRDAARQAILHNRPRKRSRRGSKDTSVPTDDRGHDE